MIELLNTTILIVSVILRIAFFTLLERKFIRYTQNRKGPNKATIIGILQPMSDAIKLIGKELNINLKSNFIIFIVSPIINIICSIIIWISFPFVFNFIFIKLRIIFIIRCSSFNTISIIIIRWSSNSNYAFIGIIRTISQIISYEINFIIIIIIIINLNEEININNIIKIQKYTPLILIIPIILVIWVITTLAETNRTPFDFSEGESELISGFNIDFRSNIFILLFLAEYSRILFIRFVTISIFTGITPHQPQFLIFYVLICILFVWTRSTFPRFRYDKLIKLNWTQILPTSIFILFSSFIIKFYYTKKNHKIRELLNSK